MMTLYATYPFFNFIPLEKHGKKPAKNFKWKVYQEKKVDEDILFETFPQQYPECNWGLVCGKISDCVVFDCDDSDAIKWAEKHLPETPFVVKTGKGLHFYYRYPKGRDTWLNALNPRSMWKVNADVRREGNYVVTLGSIHENGKVYSWAKDPFPDWEYVPYFDLLNMDKKPAPGCADAKSYLDEDFGFDMSDAFITDTIIKEGGRHNHFVVVLGKHIKDNPDATDEDVFKFAFDWNSKHYDPPLPDDEVRKTTRSLINKERAKKQAEKAQAFFKGEVSVEQATDMTGVEYLEGKELDDSLHIPVPQVLLDPPGALKVLQQYIIDSSVRTTPLFATAGALTLLSVAAGFKISSPTEAVTNTYIVCVGPSASGKNAPKAAVARLLGEYAPLYLGGDDVSSDAALVNALAQDKHHICCFQFDEIGMMLKGCKNPNSARAGLVKTLTELFSKAMSGHKKVYTDATANRRIRWHCCSIAGYSVPNEFFGSLSGGSDTNGFFGRLIVFVAGDDDRMPKKRKVLRGIPDDVDSLMHYLFDKPCIKYVDESAGNKEFLDQNIDNLTDPKPVPCEIVLTPEAEDFWNEKGDYYDNLATAKEQAEEMMAASIYARLEENAWKLAILFHFAQYGWPTLTDKGEYLYPPVSLQTVKWAYEVMEYTSATTIKLATFAIADTEFQDRCNRIQKGIMSIIKVSKRNAANRGCPEKFTPGATLTQIQKHCKQDEPEKVKQALDKLVLMGVLRLDDGSDGGINAAERTKRPIYRFVKEKPEADA